MKFFWIALGFVLSIVIISLVLWLYLIIANSFGYYGNLTGFIILVIAGFLIGIAITYFLKKFIKWIFVGVGGYLGYMLGVFCYNFFSLNKIGSNPNVRFLIKNMFRLFIILQ